MTGRLEIFRSPERQAVGVADWLVTRMQQSHGDFRLVLSGGRTPLPMYRHLAARPYRDRIPWRRLHLFWGDERFVPHTDANSNFGVALTALVLEVPIPRDNVHPIPTDCGTPEQAASRYEALLREIRAGDGEAPTRPLFDVVLLGLGADGHTASLFPESPVLDETARWVVPVMDQPLRRITLTLPAIASSGAAAFLVAGADKRNAAMSAIGGDRRLPAARVTSAGEVVWFLDRAAAEPLYHK